MQGNEPKSKGKMPCGLILVVLLFLMCWCCGGCSGGSGNPNLYMDYGIE